MEKVTKHYKPEHFSETEIHCCGAKVEHPGYTLTSSPPKYKFTCPKCNSSCFVEADRVMGDWKFTYTHSTSTPI